MASHGDTPTTFQSHTSVFILEQPHQPEGCEAGWALEAEAGRWAHDVHAARTTGREIGLSVAGPAEGPEPPGFRWHNFQQLSDQASQGHRFWINPSASQRHGDRPAEGQGPGGAPSRGQNQAPGPGQALGALERLVVDFSSARGPQAAHGPDLETGVTMSSFQHMLCRANKTWHFPRSSASSQRGTTTPGELEGLGLFKWKPSFV